MTETVTTPWDQIDIDETITEADRKAAENFDMEKQPGIFLAEVIECNAVEKESQAYTCYAAALKMKVLQVLEINQPVLDDDGKPIERDGQAIGVIKPVPDDRCGEFDALYVGTIISDDVKLFHRKEKLSIKNRRLFVARRLGLIQENTTEMNSNIWPQAVGKVVIVKTEWNTWKDQNTGEQKRNVRVGWTGYDYASNAGVDAQAQETALDEDFADI